MTPEELKNLAEQCVLYYQGRPSNKGYELSNRLTIEAYAKMTLKWLSERYCLVEKSKVKEIYDNHIGNIKSGCFEYLAPQVENYMQACYRSALQKIFGKELFKEEDK